MKTLEEIKNEIAIEQSFEDNYFNTWDKFQNYYASRHPEWFEQYFDEIAKRYAKEVAIASLEKASENAITRINDESTSIIVDKTSITNEENIVL